MLRRKFAGTVVILSLLLPSLVFGQTKSISVPREVVEKIKEEGDKRSQVLQTLRYLTDNIGPRLTNSPAQRRANEWTKSKLTEWGLQNARLESWGPFGQGWELKNFNATVQIESQSSSKVETTPFHSYPKAWSPGTDGVITAEVVYVEVETEADLEKYKGQLKGKIVLTGKPTGIKPGFTPVASRHDEKSLLELANFTESETRGRQGFQPTPEQLAAQRLNGLKTQLYYNEGVAVLVDPSFGVDAGTIRVMGAAVPPPPTPPNGGGNPFSGPRAWEKNAPKLIPQIVAASEQYNRLVRLLKQGVKVKMTIDLGVQFYDEDLMGYNTIADISGSDLKDEIVMVGAHLDSWHSATGSTDNASGVAVVMEAVRILKALNLQPRRTISVGLWTGEEQGLYGSRGHVAQNLATIGDGSMQAAFQGGRNRQITKKANYDKFSAYYNLDNGTGQIRGIYMQGNEGVRPYFTNWLQPFKDWGASTLTMQSTGGTDHLAFDGVNLPGFQFIQDPVEYFGRTWHTTQDVSDRVIEEDLKRSAIIMATFAYQTAMLDEKLPRKMPVPDSRTAFNFDTYLQKEEIAFRKSGLNFSICGHNLETYEVPHEFPLFLTVGNKTTSAE